MILLLDTHAFLWFWRSRSASNERTSPANFCCTARTRSQETPSLRNLLIRLLVTDYAHHLKGTLSPSLQPLVLPTSGTSNAVVCLAQWRDSSSRVVSYDQLTVVVADQVKIDDHPCFQSIEGLLDVMTFPHVERAVMRCLRERVASTADTINADDVRQIATRRHAGHWASSMVAGSTDVPRSAFYAAYMRSS